MYYTVKHLLPVSCTCQGNAVNYFENFSAPMAAPAREQALQLLYNKFRNVSCVHALLSGVVVLICWYLLDFKDGYFTSGCVL